MKASGYQRQISYRLLLIILWATLLVFAVELTAGWVSHSLCLLAESLHTLIDAFSALVSLVAVASPQRTLGKEIWGHGRREVLGAFGLAAILGFSSISIFLIVFEQGRAFFQTPEQRFPVSVTLSLLVVMGGMLVALSGAIALARQQRNQNQSLALKLTTDHIIKDCWLTGVMLLGLVAIGQGYRWVDPVLALVLVLAAFNSFWRLLNNQLPMLMKPTAIAPEAIAQVASQVEGVTRCTRILSRGMVGRQVWIELHIALHPEYMVIASRIGEQVERSLRDHYGPVRAQIWLDAACPATMTTRRDSSAERPPAAKN